MERLNYFRNYSAEESEISEGIADPKIKVHITSDRQAVNIYEIIPKELSQQDKKKILSEIAFDLGYKYDELPGIFESMEIKQGGFDRYGTAPVSIFSYVILTSFTDSQAINLIRTVVGMKGFTEEMVFTDLPKRDIPEEKF